MKSKVQTKRTAFTRFRALVVILSLALMGTIGVTTPAYASAPVLLSGSQWLGGNGANVCAPSTDMTCGGQAHVGGWSANWWQCVELAQRLYQMRGWHNGIFSGVNYAYQIYDRASILGMSSQANGSIGSIVPGDMIVHGSNEPYSGGAGHVSIVNSVVGSTINVIEQNTYNNDPTGQYSFSGSTLTRSGSGTIRGVVHDGDNHSIATPVTPDPTPPVELKSALSTARNADGRIELAAIGTDGNIYAKAQSVPNGSFNAGWYTIPAGAKDVTMITNADGRIELLYIGNDGAVWGRGQVILNGTFGEEYKLGGNVISIAAARNADGRIEVFTVGTDGTIYGKAQSAPNTSFNPSWYSIPAGAKDVAAASNADGRIELFIVGNDGAMYARAQVTPNGSFGMEYSLGGNLKPSITAASNADGRIELFAIGTDGNIYAKAQGAPNSSFSSSWYMIPAGARDISSAVNADGRIELLYIGNDKSVWGRGQTSINGSFGIEYGLGGNLR